MRKIQRIPSIVLVCLIFSFAEGFAADLFYFEKEGGQCLWQITTPEKNQTRTLFITNDCPEATSLVWDSLSKQTYYVLDGTIYSYDWKTKTQKAVNTTPRDEHDETFWISADTGRLRHGFLLEISKLSDDEKKGYEARYVPGRSSVMEWGIPYVAVVQEFTEKKRWIEIAVAGTSSGAGDTLGLDVLADFMKPKDGTYNTATVMEQATYLRNNQIIKGDVPVLPSAKAVFKSAEELGYLEVDSTRGFFFSAVYGDTPHAVVPVFLCSEKCLKMTPLSYTTPIPNQISLSRNGALVLISSEYYGESPAVFSTSSGTPIFSEPSGRSAMWLPFTGL